MKSEEFIDKVRFILAKESGIQVYEFKSEPDVTHFRYGIITTHDCYLCTITKVTKTHFYWFNYTFYKRNSGKILLTDCQKI